MAEGCFHHLFSKQQQFAEKTARPHAGRIDLRERKPGFFINQQL